MPIFWLTDELLFPDPHLTGEEGILAVGGDLSIERLLMAYKIGLFPWFNPEDPILWWCPNPRYIVKPNEIKTSKSMRPYFNQKKYRVTLDTVFREVILACQKIPRKGQTGDTWLTDDMMNAYIRLHELGICHSVEVWKEEELVGGLYGISLGKCFFGESMFSRANNASKFGFITIAKELEKRNFWLIDCQQPTDHLISMGAKGIPRDEFLDLMVKNTEETTLIGLWTNWLEGS